MISKDHSNLSINIQCKLLKLHRSGLYYKPKREGKLNLEFMKLIDTYYMNYCFNGARRMYKWLTMDKGYKVNHKSTERL